MQNVRFRKIVEEMSQLAGIADWQKLAEEGLLRIDGVQMQIQSDGSDTDEHLFLHIDFSTLPEQATQQFLRALLDNNFVVNFSQARLFSTNPQTGQVIAMRRIPLTDEMNGAALIELLREEAHLAKTWQHDWPPSPSPETSPDSAHFIRA